MAKSSKSQKNKNMATSKKPNGGGKPMTAAPVTSTDLTLVLEDGVLKCNLPDNTQWAGIQKFPDTTINDGASAVFEAQRNYSTVSSGKETHCTPEGAGNYRAFASEFDYDIHLSNWITI